MSFLTSPVATDLINEWSYETVLFQCSIDRTFGLNWTDYISILAIKSTLAYESNPFFLKKS